MAITISGVNNNDRIVATDGTIDALSGFNVVGLLTASHINVGSNIQLGNAGIITATTFVGNVTGNVNSTSPLLLQTGGSERFRITGNNELGIAGANYGSSGQVLTSGGSGSAVTWSAIPSQVSISNNADNRVITGGSGVNLNGEANLTFDGTTLTNTGTGSRSNIIYTSTNNSVFLTLQNSQRRFNINNVTGGAFTIYDSTASAERLRIDSNGYLSFAGDTDTYIWHPEANELAVTTAGGSIPIVRFGTGGSNGTVGIKTDSTLVTNGEAFAVRGYSSFKSLNDVYAALYTHNEDQGNGNICSHILFNVGGANRGGFGYGTDNSTLIMGNQNAISFRTGSTNLNGTERLRISSTGEMGLGLTQDPPTGSFTMRLTETPEFNIYSTQHAQNNNIKINFGVGQSASVSGNTGARIEMNIPNAGGQMTGELKFHTNSGDNLQERLRITSDGLLGLNRTPVYSGLFGGSQKGMHIGGSTAPFLRITSDTSNQGDLVLHAGNSGADISMANMTAGGDIVFWSKPTGGSMTERMRIQDNGEFQLKPPGNAPCDVAFKLNNNNDSRIKYYDSGGTHRGTFGFTEYANSTDYPNFHDSFYLLTDPSSNGTLAAAMRINHNGCFILPKQPCFSVVMSNDYSSSTSHTANFDTERFDQGDNFNTGSNGIFTAPVTGKYYMHAAIQTQSGGDSQVHIMGVAFLVNGSIQTSKGSGDQYLGRGSTHYITVHAIRILNLAQGDTVQVYILLHAQVSIEGSGGVDRCNWQGYLMA